MKFLRPQNLKDSVRSLKKRGFQVRFPGGTSYDGDINCVIIAIQFDLEGKIFFVVVPYEPHSSLFNKENDQKELRGALAIRKLREETGLIAESCDLKLLCIVTVEDNRQGQNKKHSKFYYLLEKFKGHFLNLDNSSLLSRETSTPFLISGPLIAKEIFRGHFWALEGVINKLSSRLKVEDLSLITKAIRKRKRFL